MPTRKGNTASSREAGRGRAAAQARAGSGERLSIGRLERHLWAAAEILRGSIDAGDYKGFLFGFLFLKRLSDRFDEEVRALAGVEGADPEDPGRHDFFVPKPSRWSSIEGATAGLGGALNRAAAAVEEANASLAGVLSAVDFDDARRLGDAASRDALLGRLVRHFSLVDLGNGSLEEPDMLGRAHEFLIEKFADDAGKKGGEFYTPRGVVRLLVELLRPGEGMRVCDPTCGSGGMLIECAAHLRRGGEGAARLGLFGQEKNLGAWAICRMNMVLHGLPGARIEKGDVLRSPGLVDGPGRLMRFDRVIANPPFSLDGWGREEAARDAHGRFGFGLPPRTRGDLAFVQHMIAATEPSGMIGVVVPHGVLFRGAAEGEIRRKIAREDLIEAVVGLPVNLFHGTSIPAAVLVLNRRKEPARRGKILFVDASRGFEAGACRNLLRDGDVSRISAVFHAFRGEPGLARVVALDEVEENGFNLTISRYIEAGAEAEAADVARALAELRGLERRRGEAEASMNARLRELGYEG